MTFPKLNPDWKHGAILLMSAALGGLVGYIDQQNPATLSASFASYDAAKPVLHGAEMAMLVAVIGMARKSFLAPAPTPPAGGAS
jgi:hypothetical protein